jgi:Na+/pantothenate symporter
VPLTAGLYWKKASEMGALMSIVFGMIAYLVLEMFELPIYTHIPALCVSAVAMFVGTLIFPKNKYHAPLSHHQTP